MAGCGGVHGTLGPAFADRVALLLAHERLRELLDPGPSLEVFREENARESAAARRPVPYRETARRLLAEAGAG